MSDVITVIVPCYNCASSVSRTLDSLRRQTMKGLVVLAINDGSTDHTLDVLQAYQKAHPALSMRILTKANEGIAQARNFGLDHVETPYFGFLDSDDYADPDMFFDLYQVMQKQHAQIAVSDFYWTYSKKETIQKDGPYQPGTDMMVHLFAVLWNKLFDTFFVRKSKVRFPVGYRYEDACFLYCLTMHVKCLAFTEKPYVHYVQHPGSITHTHNDQVKHMVHVFTIILDYYRCMKLFAAYQEALEYITIRFFLGNNLFRASQIADKGDRQRTIAMGWELLQKQFPNWHANPYLRKEKGLKNRIFRMMNDHTVFLFAQVFHQIGKIKNGRKAHAI